MSTPDGNLQQFLVGEVRLMTLPLTAMFDGDVTAEMIPEILGWSLSGGVDPATDQRIHQIVAGVEELVSLTDQPPQSLTDVVEGLVKLKNLWTAIREAPVTSLPASALGRNIVEGLLIHHLKLWHPILYDVMALLTVVDPPARIEPGRIGDLFTRPAAMLGDEYLGPGGLTTDTDAETIAGRLFPRLASLLGDLQMHAEYGTQPPPGPLPAPIADRVAGGLLWMYLQPDFDLPDRYGVTLALSPRERGGPGLIVLPWGRISEFWDATVDLQPAADGLLIGPGGVTLLGASDGISSAPVIAEYNGLVVGAADGTRLEIGAIKVSAGLSLDHGQHEYLVAVDLGSASLVVAAGDDDGLLASILPGDGMNVRFDLGLQWSNTGGLRLRGSAGLDATLPGASVGSTLSISAVDVSLRAAGDEIVSRVSAAVTVAVGPVGLTVAGVGFTAQLSFPSGSGNLAEADLGIDLATPTGIGISVGAPEVTGGGFLGYEPDSDRYSGALHISIGGAIDIAAWGVLQRGSAARHWSLAVFLAGHIPPIDLGLGFRLTALGGVLALHRRMDTDALRDAAAGVRGTLDDLLFPDHPETRLPQILASMERFFPPAAGSHVAGPMAEVEWGRDGQVNARIRAALLLQLDEHKIALYGSVRIGFPRLDHDSILRIRATLEALVDPGQLVARFSITILEATLFSSIHLTGGAAFFTRWGPGRTTVFTAGGFHPAYRPFIPAGLMEPPRIGLHWNPVGAIRLDVTQYFAITSTSMQFGAAAHAEVGCDWGKVTGDLAYDFLVMTSPVMYMEADLHARVTVSVFGADVLSAGLDGTLTGPGPWVFSGEVGWSLWMFDVTKSFHFEWGDPAPVTAAPQSAGEILAGELRSAGNWTSSRSGSLPVRLRSGLRGPLAPGDEIEVRQSRLPFGTPVETYEGTALTDPGVWEFGATSASGIVTLGPVGDVFPERRFRAHPSAEYPFRSGLACGARLARMDWEVPGTAIGVDAAATDDVVLDGTSTGGPVTLPAPALADAVVFALPAANRHRSFAATASLVEAPS
jgi:hypothetical protein